MPSSRWRAVLGARTPAVGRTMFVRHRSSRTPAPPPSGMRSAAMLGHNSTRGVDNDGRVGLAWTQLTRPPRIVGHGYNTARKSERPPSPKKRCFLRSPYSASSMMCRERVAVRRSVPGYLFHHSLSHIKHSHARRNLSCPPPREREGRNAPSHTRRRRAAREPEKASIVTVPGAGTPVMRKARAAPL